MLFSGDEFVVDLKFEYLSLVLIFAHLCYFCCD